MRQSSGFKIKNFAVIIYTVTALLFIVFSVCVTVFKDNNVYSTREVTSYITVENYAIKEIKDESAPIGVRKEYSFKIDSMNNNENCLIFYIVHSFAEVRLDGELVYSLSDGGNTKIGHSPSSNWVVVPLYPSDVGKTASVTITPVYKSVQNRQTRFQIGSRYAVFMHRLTIDLPQIILSCLCILMGILLIAVQIGFFINKRNTSAGMIYLGIFSFILGIWRVTDTRFSAVLFKNSTSALGYITLSALLILASPLLMFINEHYKVKFRSLLPLLTIANCASALIALALHLTDIA